jgi:hypothetical protein
MTVKLSALAISIAGVVLTWRTGGYVWIVGALLIALALVLAVRFARKGLG